MIPLLLLTAIAACCLIVALCLVEPRRERADSNPQAIAEEDAYFGPLRDSVSRHPAGKGRNT